MMRSERDGTGWQWPKGAPAANGGPTLVRDDGKRVEELTFSIHQRLLDELDTRRLFAIARPRQESPHRHNVIGIEAGRRRLHLHERANEKPGADQQNHRRGDLQHDQSVAES